MPARPKPPPAEAAPGRVSVRDSHPSVARRLAAMVYETLLVAALLMVGAFLFYGAATRTLEGAPQWAFRIYLAVIVGTYFIWCWHKGGTLAMKAWKLRVIQADGATPAVPRAALRLVLAGATVGAALIGAIGLWRGSHLIAGWLTVISGALSVGWAYVDRDGQFLHDRLAGTRLVSVERKP